MTTIEISQIKPASDAVQAAQDMMRHANNELTHFEREFPRDEDKIKHWEKAKGDAREQYERALIALHQTAHYLIRRAEQFQAATASCPSDNC